MHEKLGHSMDDRNKLKWIVGTHGNWKNQNCEGRLGLPAKQHCLFSPFAPFLQWIGRIGSADYLVALKRSPEFWFFFSIAMGADYSFEPISIGHWVPQFIGHNKKFLGCVKIQSQFGSFRLLFFVNIFVFAICSLSLF